MDRTGKEVIPTEYPDYFGVISGTSGFFFCEGLVRVLQKDVPNARGDCGYIYKLGDYLITPKYFMADHFFLMN